MLNSAFQTVSAKTLNHLLSSASWAQARLQPHAGKSFEVTGPLGAIRLQIAPDGLVESPSTQQDADVRISLTTSQWLRLTTGNKTVLKEASVEGDPELASALSYVAENLRWDYEEDMSRVVGDIAAHRIASGVQQVRTWADTATARGTEAVKDYVTEKNAIVTKRESIENFARDVDRLRDDVDRLEKRIEKLG